MPSVPAGVDPPFENQSAGTSIDVAWLPPRQSNGILTGYVLYMEGVDIYSGAETQHRVLSLNVGNKTFKNRFPYNANLLASVFL